MSKPQHTTPWEPLTGAGSEETLSFDDTTADTLTIPEGAMRARCSVFAASAADLQVAVLYLFGDDPVIATPKGQVLGHGDTLDLELYSQMKEIRFLSAETGLTGKISVSYFY